MRSINISTNVFAKIWAVREVGEETEDQILRRILDCDEGDIDNNAGPVQRDSIQSHGGFYDRRYNVHFPEGFEVFRTYHGEDFTAHAISGGWHLMNDGNLYGSLNELSSAIGVRTENAWKNWFYRDPDGLKRAVSDLRDQSRINRRKKTPSNSPTLVEAEQGLNGSDEVEGAIPRISGNITWRDDVGEALRKLGGKAPLHKIYDEVEVIRKAAGRSIPRTLDATVRRTLEDHSSDSHNFRGGHDLFYMPEGKGAGVWALR